MRLWSVITIALAAGQLLADNAGNNSGSKKCSPELIIIASRQRSASSYVTGEMGRYALGYGEHDWDAPTVLTTQSKSASKVAKVNTLSFGEPFLLPWKNDKAHVYFKHVKGLMLEWAHIAKDIFNNRHQDPLKFALALRRKTCEIACTNSTEPDCACAAAFKLFNIHTSFTHFGFNRNRSMTLKALKSLLSHPTVRVIVLERQVDAQVCSLAWGDSSQKAFNLTHLTFGPERKDALKKHYENFKEHCCAARHEKHAKTEGCPKPSWFNTQISDHKHWFELVRRILESAGVPHIELKYEDVSSSNPNSQEELARARSFAASPGRCPRGRPS